VDHLRLGTDNQNLPGYITISQPMTFAGTDSYGAAFLPAVYQGTPLGYRNTPAVNAKFRFLQNETRVLTCSAWSWIRSRLAEFRYVRAHGSLPGDAR
jgi:hypothetical protein